MKIYFCDLCNESIPLKDINSNRISIEDGKIICPKCAPKAQRKRSNVPAGLLALVGVTFAGVVVLAFLGSSVLSDLGEDVGDVRSAQGELRRAFATFERGQTDHASRLDRLEQRLEEVRADLDDRLQALNLRLNELWQNEARHDKELRAEIEASIAKLEGGLGQVQDSLGAELAELRKVIAGDRLEAERAVKSLKEQLDLLKDLLRGSVPAPGHAEGPAAGVDGAGETPEDAEVAELIAQLSDPNDGVRFAATADLGNHGGERVIAALEKMVADPADFVRKMAIRNLKKLRSLRSIPLIIQALRDEDVYVRKAARDALRALTDQDFGFDTEEPPSQREAKVKQWERWWAANRESILKRT